MSTPKQRDYPLQEPLENIATKDGNVATMTFISCKAPTGRNRDEAMILRQFFERAMKSQAMDAAMLSDNQRAEMKERTEEMQLSATKKAVEANEDPETALPITADDMIGMIGRSDVPLQDVVSVTLKLLTRAPGLALLNNSVQLTSELVNRLEMPDVEGLVGFYLAGFILKSRLEQLTGN